MQGLANKKEGLEDEDEDEIYYRLTEDRKKRLEEIGFVWSVRDHTASKNTGQSLDGDAKKEEESPGSSSKTVTKSPMVGLVRNSYDDQWDAMFERLRGYKERHGHVNVPKRCQEDRRLGTWVDTQRVQYKRLKKKLGEEVPTGPVAVPTDPLQVSFLSGAGTALIKMQDGVVIPQRNGVQLASVLKPLVGRLTEDRIQRLESLGFAWQLRDDWQKHYRELIKYKEDNGDCNVPARYHKNRRLGIWVSGF